MRHHVAAAISVLALLVACGVAEQASESPAPAAPVQIPGPYHVTGVTIGSTSGTAELQIVASTVPGVDVGFAMIPHSVSSRVLSTSEAEFFADGGVRIEIRNRGVEGEAYEPTTTHLVGYRLVDR